MLVFDLATNSNNYNRYREHFVVTLITLVQNTRLGKINNKSKLTVVVYDFLNIMQFKAEQKFVTRIRAKHILVLAYIILPSQHNVLYTLKIIEPQVRLSLCK